MKSVLIRLAVPLFFFASANTVSAQTADEIVEKSIAALGGRPAHAKVKSRMHDWDDRAHDAGWRHRRLDRDAECGTQQVANAAQSRLDRAWRRPFVLDQRFDGSSRTCLIHCRVIVRSPAISWTT